MADEIMNKVISSLLKNFKEEDIKLFNSIGEYINFSHIKDGETFNLLLHHKFKKFLRGFIAVRFGQNENLEFSLLNYSFLERHFLFWIEKLEGHACSADKSRTIMSELMLYHQQGIEIMWNYEGEYTYHLPKKVFTTHDEIVSFFDALKSLYYGKSEKYLKHIKEHLIEKSK